MAASKLKRTEVQARLKDLLSRIEENLERYSEEMGPEIRALQEIIDALEDLDFGEVQPLLKPCKPRVRGREPAKVIRLRIGAFQHIAVLRWVLSYPNAKACAVVLKAYGAVGGSDENNSERLKGWKKRLKKAANINDEELKPSKGKRCKRLRAKEDLRLSAAVPLPMSEYSK